MIGGGWLIQETGHTRQCLQINTQQPLQHLHFSLQFYTDKASSAFTAFQSISKHWTRALKCLFIMFIDYFWKILHLVTAITLSCIIYSAQAEQHLINCDISSHCQISPICDPTQRQDPDPGPSTQSQHRLNAGWYKQQIQENIVSVSRIIDVFSAYFYRASSVIRTQLFSSRVSCAQPLPVPAKPSLCQRPPTLPLYRMWTWIWWIF